MSELLGPQATPDLSLSVPSLGGSMSSSRGPSQTSSQPPTPSMSSSILAAHLKHGGGQQHLGPCTIDVAHDAMLAGSAAVGALSKPALSPPLGGRGHFNSASARSPAKANSSSLSPRRPSPKCLDDGRQVGSRGARNRGSSAAAVTRTEDREQLMSSEFPSTLRGKREGTRTKPRVGPRRPSPQKVPLRMLQPEAAPYVDGPVPNAGVSCQVLHTGRGARGRTHMPRTAVSPPRGAHELATSNAPAAMGETPPWRPPGVKSPTQAAEPPSRGSRANSTEKSVAAASATPAQLQSWQKNNLSHNLTRSFDAVQSVQTAQTAQTQPALQEPVPAEVESALPNRPVPNSAQSLPTGESYVPMSLRRDANGWPLLKEGFERLGPMLRTLEFQVGALFELMDAHASRDVADRSVTEVIYRKRESVMETFDAVKEALWWQQKRQRSKKRPGESGGQSPYGGSFCSLEQDGSGLRELEALQSQLARRVAAVLEDGSVSEVSIPASPIPRASSYLEKVDDSHLFHSRDVERSRASTGGHEWAGAHLAAAYGEDATCSWGTSVCSGRRVPQHENHAGIGCMPPEACSGHYMPNTSNRGQGKGGTHFSRDAAHIVGWRDAAEPYSCPGAFSACADHQSFNSHTAHQNAFASHSGWPNKNAMRNAPNQGMPIPYHQAVSASSPIDPPVGHGSPYASISSAQGSEMQAPEAAMLGQSWGSSCGAGMGAHAGMQGDNLPAGMGPHAAMQGDNFQVPWAWQGVGSQQAMLQNMALASGQGVGAGSGNHAAGFSNASFAAYGHVTGSQSMTLPAGLMAPAGLPQVGLSIHGNPCPLQAPVPSAVPAQPSGNFPPGPVPGNFLNGPASQPSAWGAARALNSQEVDVMQEMAVRGACGGGTVPSHDSCHSEAMGRTLDGTALSPLVLTPTAFHFKSSR